MSIQKTLRESLLTSQAQGLTGTRSMLRQSDITTLTGSPTITTFTHVTGLVLACYKFTANSTITFGQPGYLDLLLVGAGGGGATGYNAGDYSAGGGGGGAGFVIDTSSGNNKLWIPASTSHSLTIGSGGGANTAGGNSSAFGLTAHGGRSGGGTAGGTSANWMPGDVNEQNQYHPSGGRGGGFSQRGNAGGQGIQSSITGTVVWYASGGGGGNSVHFGGASGNVNGISGNGGTNAVANSGAGGGGAHTTGAAGSGGSGCIILRLLAT